MISVGFPGTVASLRQQWGRAGRRGHGLAVLVASEDALDQYFMREPETLLGRRVEAAILDHENPRVLDGHVAAAAFEAPIDEADAEILGAEALAARREHPELERRRPATSGRAATTRRAASASARRARTSSRWSRPTRAPCSGTIERERAYSTVHEGAIYLHLGERYRVARSTSTAPQRARRAVRRRLLHADQEGDEDRDRRAAADGAAARARARLRRVSVTEQVIAYQRKSIRDQAALDLVAARPAADDVRDRGGLVRARSRSSSPGSSEMPRLLGTLHAAEHAMIAILPLWAMCDRWDIGGLSTNLHFQTGRPTVFVYDGHSGGVGITERGFEAFEGWVEDTAKMLAGCPCESGCPSCVQSPEVREPERAARQGRGARAARADARRMTCGAQSMTAPLRRVLVRNPGRDFTRWREYGWRGEPDADGDRRRA